MADGRVVAVNVGRTRTVAVGERTFETGIFKEPVAGRLRVDHDHVAGDQQADHDNHGGPHQAVYAYSQEDTVWWADHLGRDDLGPGAWGENLTLAGIDASGAVVGTHWQVGGCVLRVTGPRIPCFKLAARMGDPRFAARFAEAQRPGAYLAVERPGLVGAGDEVAVLATPDHGIAVRDIARAYHRLAPPEEHRALLERIVAAPNMHPSATAFATERLALPDPDRDAP